MLVEDQKLDGIVSLPAGVFKPYSGVSTAILVFTKTNSGGTDLVWFYDLRADGYSLDDKRTPLVDRCCLGALTERALTEGEHKKNNLPDALARWQERCSSELERQSSDQSFCVSKADISAHEFDLSINRYKQEEFDHIDTPPPADVLDEIELLEMQIQTGLQDLRAMIS